MVGWKRKTPTRLATIVKVRLDRLTHGAFLAIGSGLHVDGALLD